MKLDPDKNLAPSTVEALRLAAPRPASAEIDDPALLRLALGAADAETRQRCAQALLASPASRTRLLGLRADHGGPSPEDRADLGRLAVFPGPFGPEDAQAVFPDAFATSPFSRFAKRGWLGSGFSLTPEARAWATPPDEGWLPRFVRHYAEKARRIDRVLAEGRWIDGSALLADELPNLRAAWVYADAHGLYEEAETFVFALLSPFMESGSLDDFASLAAVGHRAAEATGNVKLESRCLSYEGVVAAVIGDGERAKERWTRRLELNRREGRLHVVADALMDLAGQAQEEGDFETANALFAEAVPVVAASGNAELAATLEAAFARESLRVGDLVAAKAHAEKALASQTGASGLDMNDFIRASAARIFAWCGEARRAIDLFADILTQCVEGGKARPAANSLTALSDVLRAEGRIALAALCLAVAAGIHCQIGTRHIESSGKRLEAFLEENPDLSPPTCQGEWVHATLAIVEEISGRGKMAGAIR